ncbi:MAG: CdaR family protein [Clostridia bacterium]
MSFWKKLNVSNLKKITLTNIFYHNPFVLLFSLLCSVVIWFVLASGDAINRPIMVEVPVEITLSDLAKEEGVVIFEQSVDVADVSISGSSVIINKITSENLSVVANLSPVIQKLTGNTMVTETLTLYASKNVTDFADYQVDYVDPVEVIVVYDRYKETTFEIQSNLNYATTDDYYVESPVLSDTQVVVSGPESSVNKVSKVEIFYDTDDYVTKSQQLTLDVILYDANGEVLDLDELYLELSVEQVQVDLTVYSKQTVELDVTVLNMPSGFSSSRITIEPATIEIAGDYDIVSQYSTIVLDSAIDFYSLDTSSNTYTMNISIPESVRNISAVETATVTVNLNGFSEAEIATTNISLTNIPSDKTITVVDGSLDVTVVGTTAQVNNLTADSVFVTVDMANATIKNGNIQVTATVSLTETTSCWVYGKYEIVVNIADAETEEVN